MTRIGVTERGDAGLDLSWQDGLASVGNRAILITKNLNDRFIYAVSESVRNGANLIIHATCTGCGGTVVEPHVPKPEWTIAQIEKLIASGFGKERIVLRADPIIPGYERYLKSVLDMALSAGLLPDIRVRVSVLDMYAHVRKRFADAGITLDVNGFQASDVQFKRIDDILRDYRDNHNVKFESCAEPKLTVPEKAGCVGEKELALMGVPLDAGTGINPQNRNGCLCLAGKTELLSHKGQCPHKCLYCYWKS